ncbi:MAG: hypothetical protein ACYS22_05505 [Planctomycetota bacterium]
MEQQHPESQAPAPEEAPEEPAPEGAELVRQVNALLLKPTPSTAELIRLALLSLRSPEGAGSLEGPPVVDEKVRAISERVFDRLRKMPPTDLSASLERELASLSVRFEQVRLAEQHPIEGAERSARERAHRLAGMAHKARWLREVAGAMDGRASEHRIRDHVRTLDWIERELDRLRGATELLDDPTATASMEGARDRVHRMRLEAAHKGLSRYADTLDGLGADDSAPLERLWHAIAQAGEHIADAHDTVRDHLTGPTGLMRKSALKGRRRRGRAGIVAAAAELEVEAAGGASAAPPGDVVPEALKDLDLRPCVVRIETSRARLLEVLRSRLGALPPAKRLDHVESFATDFASSAQTVLGHAEEQSERGAQNALTFKLETADTLLWDLDALCQTGSEARKRLSKPRRQVRRARRKILDELQELEVRIGLARRFGKRFQVSIEGLVLTLILFVTALLVFEWFFDAGLSVYGKAVLAGVDTAVCALFLAEFSLRLAFAPRKLRYFTRHFLTDVLPALPFMALGFVLEPLANTGRTRAIGATKFLFYLRLARFARSLRSAKAAIRLARLFVFFQRGLDNVVKRARPQLDREVTLFTPPRQRPDQQPSIELRAAALARQAERAMRGAVLALPVSDRVAALEGRLADLRYYLVTLPRAEAERDPLLEGRAGTLQIDPDHSLDEVIADLVRADATVIEEFLGRTGGERIAQLAGLLDLPLIKRIGPIQRILRADATEPLDRTALVARELGAVLERLLALVRWFADLRGVVTGPQLVDRVGSTVIKATEKPAKRLLMLVLLLVFANVLVQGLGIEFLQNVIRWVNKVLGVPVIVIGVVAFVLMHLGRWFKKVAGEATDVYARVAEAQFYNLLVFENYRYLKSDLEILWDRVLLPEETPRLQEAGTPIDAARESASAMLKREVEHMGLRLGASARHSRTGCETGEACGDPHPEEPERSVDDSYDRVLLLYRDYLTGAPLHPSDTKTTQQLLGNLTIAAILDERLRIDKREHKRLHKLDLERGGATGPFFWFNFITLSLTEQTAKLLMEYNRFCRPRLEVEAGGGKAPPEFRSWLRRHWRGGEETAAERRDHEIERRALTHYASTEFNALHFLTADPERDERVRQRFGDEALALVRRDRRALARTIFGSQPLHLLPREQRVVNPFLLYQKYVASGRALFLPFRVLGWAARGAWWGVKKLLSVFYTVIFQRFTAQPLGVDPDPDAALRKISRMRKPIVLACMELRARFDPEYLGVLSPGAPAGTEYTATFEQDLHAVEASESVARRFHLWQRRYEDRRTRFLRLMREEPASFRQLPPRAVRELPGAPEEHESLRAAWIAYAINYRDARSLIETCDRIEDVFRRLATGELVLPRPGRVRRALRWVRRVVRTRFGRRVDTWEHGFRLVWESRRAHGTKSARLMSQQESDALRDQAWWAFMSNREGIRPLVLDTAARGGLAVAHRTGVQRLVRAQKSPTAWTRQLVTLRTVQVLSTRDHRNYRDLVLKLAEFGVEEPCPFPEEEAAPAVPVPFVPKGVTQEPSSEPEPAATGAEGPLPDAAPGV